MNFKKHIKNNFKFWFYHDKNKIYDNYNNDNKEGSIKERIKKYKDKIYLGIKLKFKF